VLVHLIASFKHATNHIRKKINEGMLKRKIKDVERKFGEEYNQCRNYFTGLRQNLQDEIILAKIPVLPSNLM